MSNLSKDRKFCAPRADVGFSSMGYPYGVCKWPGFNAWEDTNMIQGDTHKHTHNVPPEYLRHVWNAFVTACGSLKSLVSLWSITDKVPTWGVRGQCVYERCVDWTGNSRSLPSPIATGNVCWSINSGPSHNLLFHLLEQFFLLRPHRKGYTLWHTGPYVQTLENV